MRRTIRLTETDLHRVIKESVKLVLSENNYKPYKPIPKNIKIGIQVMCREIPDSVISDEKVVEGCNEYGRGFYANGFEFAVMTDDERRLSDFFSRIKAMGFFISGPASEFKDLEKEGFYTCTFAYAPTEADRWQEKLGTI